MSNHVASVIWCSHKQCSSDAKQSDVCYRILSYKRDEKGQSRQPAESTGDQLKCRVWRSSRTLKTPQTTSKWCWSSRCFALYFLTLFISISFSLLSAFHIFSVPRSLDNATENVNCGPNRNPIKYFATLLAQRAYLIPTEVSVKRNRIGIPSVQFRFI